MSSRWHATACCHPEWRSSSRCAALCCAALLAAALLPTAAPLVTSSAGGRAAALWCSLHPPAVQPGGQVKLNVRQAHQVKAGSQQAGYPPALPPSCGIPPHHPSPALSKRPAGQARGRCGEPHPRGTGAYLPLRVVLLCGSDAVGLNWLVGIGLPCSAPAPIRGWPNRGPHVHAAAPAGGTRSCRQQLQSPWSRRS